MMKTARALVLAATAALAAGCANPDQATPADPASSAVATAKPAAPPQPPHVAQDRACGAFIAIDRLAHDAIAPAPDPGNPAPKPNGTNIMSYASALQTLDRQGLSAPLAAALNAHAYALANVGALINHNAKREDVASMATVSGTTSRVIQALCDNT